MMKRNINPVFFALLLCFGTGPAIAGEADWQSFQRGSLVLLCQAADVYLVESVLASAEAGRAKIADVIPVDDSFVINIVLAPSEEAYTLLTGKSMPRWSAGAANPGAGIIYLKSPRFVNPSVSLDRIIGHELSHILLGGLTGYQPVDRWFDEGLAEYISGPMTTAGALSLARSAASGELHSFDALNGMLGFSKSEAGVAYLEARSAIDYLIREQGGGSLKAIVRAMSHDMDLEDAMRSVTGITLDAFETGWKQDLRRRYRWALLMDFPTLITSLFVLFFFMALTATIRRVRRKKHEWEEESDG